MKTKKSKRIISLILALAMIFTFMAMSASAATTEVPEVQPRTSICPMCGGYGYTYWYSYFYDTDNYENHATTSRGGCIAGPATHVHYLLEADIYSRCATCHYSTYYHGIDGYCPYGGT